MRNLSHKKGKLRKSEEDISKELLESMVEKEVKENSELNQITKNVVKLVDTVTCVRKYKKIVQIEKQNINITCRLTDQLHTPQV